MMQSILLTDIQTTQTTQTTKGSKTNDAEIKFSQEEEFDLTSGKKQFSEFLVELSIDIENSDGKLTEAPHSENLVQLTLTNEIADKVEDPIISNFEVDIPLIENNLGKEGTVDDETTALELNDDIQVYIETDNLLVTENLPNIAIEAQAQQVVVKDSVDASVLAKIEMALKIDTRVTGFTEVKQNNVKVNEKEELKNNKVNIGEIKQPDFKLTETNLANPVEKTAIETKIVEPLSTNFPTNAESHLINTKEIKLTNVNDTLNIKQTELTAKTVQSNALQQPVELQSKQASAMLTERVLMMLNLNKQEITIRLDPAELGSMSVKVQVQNDQVQLSIQTYVGQTKELLEQHLPRLKEQLAEQGIDLSEANIEQQNQKNSGEQNAPSDLSAINDEVELQVAESNEDIPMWLASEISGSDKKVDYYA